MSLNHDIDFCAKPEVTPVVHVGMMSHLQEKVPIINYGKIMETFSKLNI